MVVDDVSGSDKKIRADQPTGADHPNGAAGGSVIEPGLDLDDGYCWLSAKVRHQARNELDSGALTAVLATLLEIAMINQDTLVLSDDGFGVLASIIRELDRLCGMRRGGKIKLPGRSTAGGSGTKVGRHVEKMKMSLRLKCLWKVFRSCVCLGTCVCVCVEEKDNVAEGSSPLYTLRFPFVHATYSPSTLSC